MVESLAKPLVGSDLLASCWLADLGRAPPDQAARLPRGCIIPAQGAEGRHVNERYVCVAVLLVCLAGGISVLQAQGTTAQITGLVTDATGAVVPKAEILVSNQATGIKRNTASNQLGYYTVSLLPPGSYRISLKKEGFRPIDRAGITLEVDQVARIDFSLQVGTLAEVVEVTANASRVDTQTSTLKEVVDERRIRELPLNGRDAN